MTVETQNKRELYTLWSLQPLTTICRSNMTVETQKQKRIIHFVITTTIDHYLSVYDMTLETQKQKRIIHFVITTTIDHYLSV